MHSYEYAVVVDIVQIPLTVSFLKPNINNGWLYDDVSMLDCSCVHCLPPHCLYVFLSIFAGD
jgi:hypothetical protein